MKQELKNLLGLGAIIGLGYLTFTHLTKEKLTLLSLETTRKITQEIKHQVFIISINFADGIKQKLSDIMKSANKDERERSIEYFRTKMAEIYQQKQNLILNKFNVSIMQYEASLKHFDSDPTISRNNNEIIDVMECAINGEYPDLTIPNKEVHVFSRDQLENIYEEMSKSILIALTHKLRSQKQKNPEFDSNNNEQFKKAVRELNVFEMKEKMLKEFGFKAEWGSSNEMFFKLMEAEKIKDPKFKQKIKSKEAIYDKGVDDIAKNPAEYNIAGISTLFNLSTPEVPKKEEEAEKDSMRELSKSMNESGWPQVQPIEHKKSSKSKSEQGEVEIREDDVPDEAAKSRSNKIRRSNDH